MKRSNNGLIVAILTTADKRSTFQGNRENFKEILLQGASMGVMTYVITCEDLQLNAKRLWGYRYVKATKKWERGLFPHPTVIYNRIPTRKQEQRLSVRRKINKCLRSTKVHIFNPYFFNKRQLFDGLQKLQISSLRVPATCKMDRASFLKMAKSCSVLYLKPENGKAGQGIMSVRIGNSKDKPYVLRIQSGGSCVTIQHSSIEEAWKSIRNRIGKDAYIVQQGIQLASTKGRRYDLRLLVQKNQFGKWKVTGIGARISGRRSITTHVPRGGKLGNPYQLLQSSFGSAKAIRILRDVKLGATKVAACIERNRGNALGEMSMDIGVDKNGHSWFFEANAKPMKFDEVTIRKLSLKRLFQYASFLARSS